MTETPSLVHSIDLTRTLAIELQRYMQEDPDSEYDVYEKIVVSGDKAVMRVDFEDEETGDTLEYRVVIEPVSE